MTETNAQAPLLTPRKILLQALFWLIGLALLAWVIKSAFDKGGGADMWNRICSAPPRLLLTLLGCTILSAIFNASTFWITIQPLRAVRWRDMNMLNLFAGMLNYAPVRVGAILRVAYHMRVDRLTLVQIGGWFALVGYVMFLGIGAVLLATLMRDRIDGWWLGLVIVQMGLGGAALRFVAAVPIIQRHARGLDKMAVNQRGLWGAIVLRIIDLGAFAGRMAAASAILGMHLEPSQVMVLAVVALVGNLMPLGSLGFREFFVSLAAAKLSMEHGATDAVFSQLALLDRAGEALVYLPLGILAIPWYRSRWKNAARA